MNEPPGYFMYDCDEGVQQVALMTIISEHEYKCRGVFVPLFQVRIEVEAEQQQAAQKQIAAHKGSFLRETCEAWVCKLVECGETGLCKSGFEEERNQEPAASSVTERLQYLVGL